MHTKTNEKLEKHICAKEGVAMHFESYESALLDRMLTVDEVAHLLHVHPGTVRRWEKQGQLKSYRLGPKGIIRFKSEGVSDFINLVKKSWDRDGADFFFNKSTEFSKIPER